MKWVQDSFSFLKWIKQHLYIYLLEIKINQIDFFEPKIKETPTFMANKHTKVNFFGNKSTQSQVIDL